MLLGDRLFLGTATGDLHVYTLGEDEQGLSLLWYSLWLPKLLLGDKPQVKSAEVKKALSRKSIEQLGFVKDVNSLVILSGTNLLYQESVFSLNR